MEYDFYNKFDKHNVQAGKKDKILLAHVQRICEAHDTVMQSYYQQMQKKIVASRRGAVVEEAFYDKIDKLNVQAGKMDKILLAHVPRICAWHKNAILLSANTEVTF